ncbi:ABC transporter ATP-binding protein [Leptospira sp. 201903070]|uniref:ABC transporter ATP-binding protein n=1 Tax=Leptospira ainlahdjerensis TaxID=2810033 RepID=A0ABS2U671_9LEPT|nr:ABC transporter ATP-binding protein [Leptospira ainlahdjerensis]MBM9575876.1 ABC transporter ATP-binding protein [Leptospira ainlahdjerensis]
MKRQSSIVSINNLSKSYSNGFQALKNVSLEIQEGEIIALLGPNGAGKTTLISIICGIVNPSDGFVHVAGKDILTDFRFTRSKIGLVPQELSVHAFESVWATVSFTRGLYGKAPNPSYIEKLLKSLSLWDKKDSTIITLSGGMKRRVLIAKALSHEPAVLFLDEPTAGVDVELRKDMWNIVRNLRENGVTIILTTHYIEEAEEIADRIGVMNKGELILVEDKKILMQKLGKKQIILDLSQSLKKLPSTLKTKGLELSKNGKQLVYTYDSHAKQTGISALLQELKKAKIEFQDLNTTQSSLEEIFVQLVKESE